MYSFCQNWNIRKRSILRIVLSPPKGTDIEGMGKDNREKEQDIQKNGNFITSEIKIISRRNPVRIFNIVFANKTDPTQIG